MTDDLLLTTDLHPSGMFHLRTAQDLGLFAVHCALMLAVAFLFAAVALI